MDVDCVCLSVIPAAGVFAGCVHRCVAEVRAAAACRLEGMQASCPHPATARPAVSSLPAAFFCPSCKQHDGPAWLQPRPWSSPYATLYWFGRSRNGLPASHTDGPCSHLPQHPLNLLVCWLFVGYPPWRLLWSVFKPPSPQHSHSPSTPSIHISQPPGYPVVGFSAFLVCYNTVGLSVFCNLSLAIQLAKSPPEGWGFC